MTVTASLSKPLSNRLINTILCICPAIDTYRPFIVAFDLSPLNHISTGAVDMSISTHLSSTAERTCLRGAPPTGAHRCRWADSRFAAVSSLHNLKVDANAGEGATEMQTGVELVLLTPRHVHGSRLSATTSRSRGNNSGSPRPWSINNTVAMLSTHQSPGKPEHIPSKSVLLDIYSFCFRDLLHDLIS